MFWNGTVFNQFEEKGKIGNYQAEIKLPYFGSKTGKTQTTSCSSTVKTVKHVRTR